MKMPEFTRGEIADACDATYRTMHCLTASAVALTALYIGTPLESEATRQDAVVRNLPAVDCHDMSVDQGATMEQALGAFSARYPTKNGLSAFMEFSVDHNVGPATPLAKSVLTVCLSPDRSAIESISSVPQDLTVTPAASSNR